MKSSVIIKLWLIGMAIAALGLFSTNTVSAHGGRQVGKYEFDGVGFVVEPAFEGLMNGVELQVHIPAEVEGQDSTPVEGLEETLQVEITHVSSGVSKTLELEPVFGDPGRYTAELIPTAPGQYRFRFFGAVEELEVDETFDSGSGDFDDVESARDLQFPNQLPAMREFEGAVRGAIDTAERAQDSASTANFLAITGIVLGVIGAVSGVGSVVMTRKRQ